MKDGNYTAKNERWAELQSLNGKCRDRLVMIRCERTSTTQHFVPLLICVHP